MSQLPIDFAPTRKVYTVSEISQRLRELLERNFRDVWVQGEVSNFRAAPSGHFYFTLKDPTAQIRCVCFRQNARYLKFKPEDGLEITVRGTISVYETRGEYQLYVEYLEPVGFGALQLAFEQLKARLKDEGLFEVSRKKPLPMLPQRIGLITSPRGAVIADMIRILRRRYENLHLMLYPVRVQGEGAADDIVEALQHFSRARNVDVLIVARGGGSIEDLWAFNEEKVARAIAGSTIPVISAVGHESDFTIADFVADLRAPTPSAAAELVVETKAKLSERVQTLAEKLVAAMRYGLLVRRHELQDLATDRAFRTVEDWLRSHVQLADELAQRLKLAAQRRLAQVRQRLELAASRVAHFDLKSLIQVAKLELEQNTRALATHARVSFLQKRNLLQALAAQLGELSPLKILERGYAICYDAAWNVVKDAAAVALGDEIAVRLAQGRLGAQVKKKDLGKE